MVNGFFGKLQFVKYPPLILAVILVSLIILVLTAGCVDKAKMQIEAEQQLAQDNIAQENAALQEENAQLKKQIETLAGIDKALRIEAITSLSKIELTRRCNLVDKNDDGNLDTLRVCLRTLDDIGDMVKAAGEVKIELWDLEADEQNAMIKSWEISAEVMKKAWSGTLLTSYFKFELDVTNENIQPSEAMTVRAEFVDYLTGQTLSAQKQIKLNTEH